MGLVPADFHRADGAQVQAVNGGALEELICELRVFGDGGDDEGITNFAEDFGLLHLDHTGIGAEEFAVGQGVVPAVAMNNRGAQEGAALELHLAGAVAVLRGHIFGTGLVGEVGVDHTVDVVGHLGVGEAGEAGIFIIRRQGLHRAEALGDGIGDFLAVFRHNDGGGIDAGTAAVVADGADDDVNILLPIFDLVFTNDDLAPAGAVDLHAGVAFVHLGHGHIAKDEVATTEFHHFTAAFMVGGVKAKGLCRGSGGDESLNEAEGGPGLFAAWFDDHGDLQGDGWQPQRVHRRGVAGHHEAEGIGGGEVGHGAARLGAETLVNHRHVEASGQAVEDDIHVGERVVQLGHVALHHDVRQAAGARKGGDVFFRALGVAFVAQGQGAIEEEVTRLGGDLDELGDGELLQGLARLADLTKVLAHDACIHLAHLGADLARLVVFHRDFIQRFVRAAFAKSGEVGNGRHGRMIGRRRIYEWPPKAAIKNRSWGSSLSGEGEADTR